MKNYNTYFLSCVNEHNEIDNIIKQLNNKKIKIINLEVFDMLPKDYINNLEQIFNNLPLHIEILIIMHLNPIFNLSHKYNNKLNLTNLPINLKKVFISDSSLLNLKLPFNCELYDITDKNNEDLLAQLKNKIIPYN